MLQVDVIWRDRDAATAARRLFEFPSAASSSDPVARRLAALERHVWRLAKPCTAYLTGALLLLLLRNFHVTGVCLCLMGHDCRDNILDSQNRWSWGACSPVVSIILLQVLAAEGQLE